MKKFGRMMGEHFGWLIQIYYGITSERFTRLFLMFCVFAFAGVIHDRLMSLDRIARQTQLIEEELAEIDFDLTRMANDLESIEEFGLKTRPR